MTQTLTTQAAAALDDSFFSIDACRAWILQRIHPNGAACPNCNTAVPQGKALTSYWLGGRVCCSECKKYYTAHTGTILAGTDLSYQAVFALAVLIGLDMPDRDIADRLNIHRDTVRDWRDRLNITAQSPTTQG